MGQNVSNFSSALIWCSVIWTDFRINLTSETKVIKCVKLTVCLPFTICVIQLFTMEMFSSRLIVRPSIFNF